MGAKQGDNRDASRCEDDDADQVEGREKGGEGEEEEEEETIDTAYFTMSSSSRKQSCSNGEREGRGPQSNNTCTAAASTGERGGAA